MSKILIVGVGGFIGAIARYVLSGIIHRLFGPEFPVGTIVVNIIGCFVLGAIIFVGQHYHLLSPHVRLFVGVGLIGAFTTFSTFGHETLNLIHGGEVLLATANIFGNVALGIAAVWFGYSLLQVLHR
jgi:CrcB protein